MPGRWLVRVGVPVVLVVAVVAVTLSTGVLHRPARPSSSVAVASDLSVLLPAGVDPAPFRFASGPVSAAAARSLAGSAFKVVMPPRDLSAARPLPAGTKLRLQAEKHLRGPVFEAYFDPAARRWVPEPTTYEPATGVAIATVAHLSDHGLFTWATDRIGALFEGALHNLFGPARLTLQPPDCGLEHGVAMQVSNRNESVVACHDATVVERPEAGRPGAADITVKLVNARPYPIDVVYPSTATARTDAVGSVAAQVGAAITAATSRRAGTSRVLVPAGATATVTMPKVPAPFASARIATQLDGEAYLVGLLSTAIDELATLRLVAKQRLLDDLLKELSAAKVLERVQVELADPDLSLETIRTLGDIGLDALQAAVERAPVLVLTSVVALLIQVADAAVQTIWGLVDSASGQSYHRFTFSPYGAVWSQATDLHRVDWRNATIPGRWFLGPSSVKLTDGEATGVATTIQYDGADETESVYGGEVVYGDLDGDGNDEAALQVLVNPAGVAAADRAQGWVVFRGGPGGPEPIGVVVGQVPPATTWQPNPRDAGHITYVGGLRIARATVLAQELYYRSPDGTCCPSGPATTVWAYRGDRLLPGTPQITQ